MTTLLRQNPKCPRCGALGTRIESSATLANGTVTIDDSYCGRCGKRWPQPPAKGQPTR